MTFAVAVSGGQDSLYALLSLRDAFGASAVFAVHARFREETDRAVESGLAAVCKKLGVAFHIVDLREQFHALIVRPFAEAYARGETPNPCAHCNRRLKFGLLLDEARKLGAEKLATGHYADFAEHPRYGAVLRRGADPGKDQSYFLALTPACRLKAAVFPLGTMQKKNVRAALEQRGMSVPAPEESQEICFVPHDDYRAFLRTTGIRLPEGGPMVTGDGLVVGRHQGLWQYTEGQRRGLGVSWTEPLYVVGKDRARNALLLGTAAELKVGRCVAAEINLLVPPELWPNDLFVRTRYRQNAVPADVRIQGPASVSARMLIRFHTPQLPAAPGQIVAVYDADGCVLAGAVLRKDI